MDYKIGDEITFRDIRGVVDVDDYLNTVKLCLINDELLWVDKSYTYLVKLNNDNHIHHVVAPLPGEPVYSYLIEYYDTEPHYRVSFIAGSVEQDATLASSRRSAWGHAKWMYRTWRKGKRNG